VGQAHPSRSHSFDFFFFLGLFDLNGLPLEFSLLHTIEIIEVEKEDGPRAALSRCRCGLAVK